MKKYSLLLLLLLIPYYAFAAEDASAYPNLKFTPIDDATCSVGKANEDIKEAIIPSEVTISGKNYIVTKIRDNAFSWCSSLTSVEIPNSVTSIGFSAFAYCGYLGSVVISSTVTKIETTAFDTCESLSRLIFRGSTCPAFVENVFAGVKSCTVYVPKGASVDSYRSELENARLGISKIKTYDHFEGDYPNLVFTPIEGSDSECSVKANPDNKPQGEVTIPSTILKENGNIYNVTSIGDNAFKECHSLTSVIIPESVTEMGRSAFMYSGITSVTIPGGIKTISVEAFSNTNLSSVTIMEGVESIEASAFWICNLKTAIIPATVTHIGSGAFDDSLNSIIFKSNQAPELDRNFVMYNDSYKVYIPEGAEESYRTALGDNANINTYKNSEDCKELVFTPIEGKEGECSVKAANKNIKVADIPSTILKSDGNIYNVTAIEEKAFNICLRLESVCIPASIKSIGNYAFSNCTSLISVEISSSVTSIGDSAFYHCIKLKSLIFKGDTAPVLGNGILTDNNDCKVYVPFESKDKYVSAFDVNNKKIDASRVKGYVDAADCPELVFTQISGKEGECSVKAANNGIKGDNGKLVIPSAILKVDGSIYNVTTIEAEAFDDCYALTSITIPEGVTEIEHSAFELCASLTSVKIPNSVTSIGPYAFYTCSSLTSVKIPNSVTSIGKRAFSYCWGLKSLIFTGETCPETLGTDILYNSDKCTFYVPESAIGTYVTALGVDASRVKGYVDAADCPDLLFTPIEGKEGECSVKARDYDIKGVEGKLVIPSTILKDGDIYNVTVIEERAFRECTLTSIILPEGVTSIGNSAFEGCGSLTSITIPEGVTEIEDGAFNECRKLADISIPSSVISIGEAAFSCCYALTSITIPEDVTTIRDYTFTECQSLAEITIPDGVTSIGKDAFYGCTQLNSLIFKGDACSNNLGTRILDGTNCTVYVPEDAMNSFLKPLADVNVDASRVKGYVDAADCPDLVFTQISGKNGECSVTAANESITGDVVIPSTILKDDGNIYNVISIGNYAFDCCNSLTSVKIPSSVTSIGRGAFIYCNSLTSAKIPSSVTSIGDRAFFTCGTLTSVEISSSVTAIGTYAFAYCTQLKTVIFKGNTYPNIGSDAFDEFNGTVYVLNETLVESFKAKFPDNEVKPLLDFTLGADSYIKSGDEIAVTYPEGYAPEELIYSIPDGSPTITDNVITGHGAATVRVADAGNENIYAETTLNVYVSGDSNDNGTVDITDAVTTANYIVGKEPEKFLEIAADVVPSDPSAITIADVVATVDIMLDAPAPEPSDDPKALMAPANSVDCLTLRVAREGIALSLAGQGVFSALQADVTLPAGATLNGVHAGDRLTGNHSVMYRMVDDRTVRVAVFALSLDTFVQGDAVVILDVEGMSTGDVTAANVIASDADGNGYRLGVDGGGMSGIDGVVPGEGAVVRASGDGITVDGAQGMTVEVYGMDGRLVKCFTAGDDDRVTVDLVPGVYLVRVGAATAVKIAVR